MGENGAQQRDDQADAQAGAGSGDDIGADITRAFKLAQVALHGTAAFAHGAGEVGHSDLRRAGVAVSAVGVGGEDAGAASGAVGEVGVGVEACGQFGHVCAAVADGDERLLLGGQVAAAQRTVAADLVGGNCLNDLAAAVAVDAAFQLVLQGGDVVHGLSVVTGKPAGKRVQTGVCKISLAPGSEFCEGGIVRSTRSQFCFFKARPSGGFSISGSLVPQDGLKAR